MKRLLFNHVFVFLVITTFIFVAAPAMAAVTIDISGTVESDAANTGRWKIVVKLTYSAAPHRQLTVDDFSTLKPSTDVTVDEGTDNDPKTYFITWTNVPTRQTPQDVAFYLRGYETVYVDFTTPPNLVFAWQEFQYDPNNLQGPPLGSTYHTITQLVIKTYDEPTDLPGLSYAIIVANASASATVPTLPTNSPPYEIVKVAWDDVSDQSMPNLWTHFQGGGTLNLRVNELGTTNRLGSKTAGDTYDDDQGRNQRQVVINEVMWAEDQEYTGTAARVVEQQWIEIYNRTVFTIAFGDIKLITSKAHPGPPPETDRVSNNGEYDITWDIDERGQHGSSEAPLREFKSMQRINYTNGWEKEHWDTASVLYIRNFRGTPGKPNQAARVPTPRRKPSQDNPAKNKIIINEIGNFSDDTLDWIELRNVTGSAQSLNNWALTKTTGYGNESEIVRFPDYSIEARGVLLLVNRVPWQTSLSLGYDIQEDAVNQEFGAAPHRYLVVDDNNVAIPNHDAWLLLLRSNKPWDVGDGRDVYQTGHSVEDAAGPAALSSYFLKRDIRVASPDHEKKSDGNPNGDIWETKVFPLNGNLQADGEFLQSDRLTEVDKVWVRDGAKQGYLKDAWEKASFTGIGYDRSVQANDQNSGTPGYDNNVVRGRIAQLDGGKLIVSELMLTTSDNRLPQWIELYNTSRTRAIDLASDSSDPKTGWQLIIENHESGSWKENKRHLNITVNLKDLYYLYSTESNCADCVI